MSITWYKKFPGTLRHKLIKKRLYKIIKDLKIIWLSRVKEIIGKLKNFRVGDDLKKWEILKDKQGKILNKKS